MTGHPEQSPVPYWLAVPRPRSNNGRDGEGRISVGDDNASTGNNGVPLSRIPWSQLRVPRDTILFFGGLFGVYREMVVQPQIRTQALIFFAGMMGMVAPLRRDDRRQDRQEGEP